jgi:putative ABC transport system permease protein
MLTDIRLALRLLTKSPGFTTVAVITLALAIGVNTAIFSLVNGLVLQPVVPVKPKEVVGLFTALKGAERDYRQFSHAEFQVLRQSPEVFKDVTAVNFILGGIGRDASMHRSFVFLVAENFFSMLGAQPAAGRFFDAAESAPNANLPVVVASYTLWQKSGRSPDFIGSTLYVNGKPYTVIGVAPRGFNGVNAILSPEIFLPLGIFSEISSAFSDKAQITDLADPRNYTLNLMARLNPGQTIESTRPRLTALEQRLNELQPAELAAGERELQLTVPSRFGLSTGPGDDGPINLIGTLMIAMAGVVLVIASLNLANMLLARGTARAREVAVRLAVGATRWRIIRQLLIEGLVLALLGGAAGILLSFWSNSFLSASFSTLLTSMNFSLAADLTPDRTVLAVTLIFCVLATLVFSLGPALRASRSDMVTDLKAQAGDPAVHGRWNRFFAGRHLLVMGQMTLSLVLIFSAGLFFRGALVAGGLDRGFKPEGVIMTELDFSLANTSSAEGLRRMVATAERVRSIPGVTAAGYTTLVPYGNITRGTRVMPADAPPVNTADPKAPKPGAGGLHASITPGYFAAISVPILRGRDFTALEASVKDSPPVAILDEALAKALFPDKDALGQRIRYTQPPADGSPSEMEVVGIVRNHRNDVNDSDGLNRRLFVPLAQSYNASAYLAARFTTEDPAAILAAIDPLRRELRNLDPELPVIQMLPFTYLMERSIMLWIIRLGAVMFGVFGGIALLLAVVGVYGVKAYAVERRTREIGIRIALGADHRDIFALIMRQGALQIAVSLSLGLILSLLAGQALASMLYKVSPADPVALGVAILLLASTTLIACFLPARRATRVSPTEALRAE